MTTSFGGTIIPANRATALKMADRRPTAPSHTALGILFALTGALIATSIVNIGESGVPLFFLTFALPVGALAFGGIYSRYFSVSRSQAQSLLIICGVFVLVGLTVYFQFFLNIQSPAEGLSHAIVRESFLAYCAVCLLFLRGGTMAACLRWLRRILIVIALYGIYQVPAKLFGLALFLDWLRNNPSFNLYDFGTAGWVGVVRSTSIYAEPSQCAVPILVLSLLNFYLPAPKWSKSLVWIAVFLFTVLTFSRTIWLMLATLAIVMFVVRSEAFRRAFIRYKLAFAGALIALVVLMPAWAFVGSNYKADLSRQERAGSIVVGLHVVMQHPILGSGWNSFEILVPAYQAEIENANPIVSYRTIHNMFVSYAEQAGLAGFLFGIIPFAMMLFQADAPIGIRLASALPLLAGAELGGDVAYSSLFWLWVAIVLNWRHANAEGDPYKYAGHKS